jgi:ribonuclease P protein component
MGEASARASAAVCGRPNRLPKRADFIRLTASRIKVATPAFLLQAAAAPLTSSTSPSMRIGFTASRKIGNAVARNRARRRLRALAARIMPGQARADWDYVFVARQASLDREFASMEDDLARALHRIGALAGEAP